jgi:hypothetical protein
MYIGVMVGRTIMEGHFPALVEGWLPIYIPSPPSEMEATLLSTVFGNGGWMSCGRQRRRAQQLPTGPDWDMRIPEIPKKYNTKPA